MRENNGSLTTTAKAVGGLTLAFVIGVIFWAGSAYNRIANIEMTLLKIEAQLPALGKVAVLEERTETEESQIRMLQDELARVKRIVE